TQEKRNATSAAMGQMADKKSDAFAKLREEMRTVKETLKGLDERVRAIEEELDDVMLHLPNLPADSTPDGLNEESNVVVRTWGEAPSFSFEPKDHVEVGTSLGILDFERATKISGSRFVVLRGLGARLERALMQFMLDLHVDQHGYEELWPPAIVNDASLRGTSQLPKFAKDVFRLAKDEEWAEEHQHKHDLYLVPTAEVPVSNFHADEILSADQLPVAYCAYTPCFRSEAGSYGRDTRGMIRQHQFDKVELVRFVTPDQAQAQHQALTEHAEKVLQLLGLHYRVVELCAGDLGFAARKCYDIEVWLPAQKAYREISSCSWFGDFQARRMRCRFRAGPKEKPQLVHTINGSGLAIGRTLVAILEQNQQEDGSVVVPEALRAYLGGKERIQR
ncbi:MAG: serine--tRNA ligase, partial [Myxococcota bacterium]